MLKQRGWAAVVAAMLTVLLVACGDATATSAPASNSSATTAPAASGGATTAPAAASGGKTINFNSNQSDPTPKKIIADTVTDYQTKSGNKVNLSTVAHEDFKQAIRTWLTSDNPPDAMTWFAGNRMRFFVDKGLIADVSDVWEKNGWTKSYPEGFQNLSKGKDGKFYFLPQSWYWWGMFYRKSTFTKYGLTPPKTWDEFLAVADKLKANGVTPFALGAKAPWTLAGWFDYLDLRINGYDYHIQLMEGKAHYTDPQVKNVFKYWKQLIDKGYFAKDATAYAWEEQVPNLVKGQAGMYLIGRFIFDSTPKDVQDDLDFFQFPVIDPKVAIAEEAPTDGFFLSAKAKNLDAAKNFLTYLGSADAQKQYVTASSGGIAASNDVPASSYPPLTQRGVQMIQSAKNVAQFYDRDTDPAVAERGMALFAEFFTNTNLDLDTKLAQLDKDAQDILTRANK